MPLPPPSPRAVALVTGASAGIGAELARELARRGHALALVARRRERLEDLAQDLRAAHGVEVEVHPCDLADDAARAALVETLLGGERDVDVVCNNAGYGSFGVFHQRERDWERGIVRLNALALLDLTHAFLGPMVERRNGAILNVGSIAGFQPLPHNATYAASKAFVNSFTEAISAELSGSGVTVTLLCPGPVSTEFGEAAGVADVESRLPNAMFQTADEVARAGIEGLESGRRVVFSNLAAHLSAQGGRLAPHTLLMPLIARFGAHALRER
jgi:short-subunit dehydrogenase